MYYFFTGWISRPADRETEETASAAKLEILGNQPLPGVSENGIWLCFVLRRRTPPKRPNCAARTRRPGERRSTIRL